MKVPEKRIVWKMRLESIPEIDNTGYHSWEAFLKIPISKPYCNSDLIDLDLIGDSGLTGPG